MRVLLVEDHETLRERIAAALKAAGWTCVTAGTAAAGLSAAAGEAFDAVVLDRTLPDGEGLEVLDRLRGMGVRTPVLVLSALAETPDRIAGLDSGADDYLGKPFAMEELIARLTALHRRSGADPHPAVMTLADLQVWRNWNAATRAGQGLHLTDQEYRLLLLLIETKDQVVTRQAILRQVLDWRADVPPPTQVVEVAVNRLRSKLDKPFKTPLLHTLRGRGYMLSATRPAGAAA